jgi:hypothetical protein
MLLLAFAIPSLSEVVTIVFFNDESCSATEIGGGCWDIGPDVCCGGGNIWGSAYLYVECLLSLAIFVPAAWQGSNECGVILGQSGPVECFVSEGWQITSAWWYRDFCLFNIKERDAALELIERDLEVSTGNATAPTQCQEIDMHVLRVDDMLHGIRINSSEGESLKAFKAGSKEQKQFMLDHSHVSKPWKRIEKNVLQE